MANPLLLLKAGLFIYEKVKARKQKEIPMDKNLGSLLRHALTFAGGYWLPAGLFNANELELGAGAVATLLGLAWSVWEKRKR